MKKQNNNYLKLLSVFHYVVGIIIAAFACFPIIHLLMGISMVSGAVQVSDEFPFQMFGWLFVVLSSIFILTGWIMAVAIMMAGRKLAQRKAYTYCLVIAGIECIFMPFGTILGVLTIIMLMKDEVKAEFFPSTVSDATFTTLEK